LERLNTANFYADIVPFDTFADVADLNNYQVAPDDWHVIIADVKGSTQAIEEGRYKQVNMIGAACINAVLNITEKGSIPYVFGGDGATLLVPSSRLDDCKQVLLGVRYLAATRFNLSLRVGVVAVATIHAHSSLRVMVGKYQLSPVNALATFSGGGMELAEKWIKSGTEYLLEQEPDDKHPDLSGLSCRWEPLESQNGVMLSLLMQASQDDKSDKTRIYRQLIEDIGNLSDDTGSTGKPVCDANMKFRWPPRGLPAEIDATVGTRNRSLYALRIYLSSMIQFFLDRFDLSAGGYQGKQYRVELRDNTDYRRFDDTLRILLDCTAAQADAIDTMLALRAQRGELKYGLHRSDSALMTCLVFNLDQGEHLHFVDGSDGGFTSAAKNMKAKKRDN
ncbi:MAG: DUF3095 domain-containing protein, partial [Gammaproteobacteria bacterium]|nr:DUF3095 domain-containing protein [Gammaproteobacteria bacterium]